MMPRLSRIPVGRARYDTEAVRDEEDGDAERHSKVGEQVDYGSLDGDVQPPGIIADQYVGLGQRTARAIATR